MSAFMRDLTGAMPNQCRWPPSVNSSIAALSSLQLNLMPEDEYLATHDFHRVFAVANPETVREGANSEFGIKSL